MLSSFKPNPAPAFVLASLMMAQIYFVRRFPQPGESLQALDLYCETGGKGLNVLLGLYKLGIPLHGLIPCGTTPLSQHQCQDILSLHQLTHINRVTVGEYNGHGVALIDEAGQNQITVHAGANALLTAEHIQPQASAIQQASLVYASFESSEIAICAAFTLAQAAGRLTVLNPSPFKPLTPNMLALSDVLIMNQSEAAAWLQVDQSALATRQAAQHLLHELQFTQRYPGKSLILTLGDQGAIALLDDGSWHEHAAYSTTVVDSLGAGDAFASALLASLLQSSDLTRALEHGCASASLLIRQRGVIDNLPTPTSLQAFLSAQ